jgi:hypothetical protein
VESRGTLVKSTDLIKFFGPPVIALPDWQTRRSPQLDLGPIQKCADQLTVKILSMEDDHGFFWFGFSGGRGDGSLEMLFLVTLAMIALVSVFHFSTK